MSIRTKPKELSNRMEMIYNPYYSKCEKSVIELEKRIPSIIDLHCTESERTFRSLTF